MTSPLTRQRSILHLGKPRQMPARDNPLLHAQLLYEYITNTIPRLDRYLQSNSKQPKTYKALYQSVNTIVTRVRLLQIDDCDIHNGHKVLVNTS